MKKKTTLVFDLTADEEAAMVLLTDPRVEKLAHELADIIFENCIGNEEFRKSTFLEMLKKDLDFKVLMHFMEINCLQ